MRILISSPIHMRDWILEDYLNHIQNIEYPKDKTTIYFLINNSTDRSEEILREFRKNNKMHYEDIIVEKFKSKYRFLDKRSPSVRLGYTYHHLSDLRNHILNFANKRNFDWMLSCDSDILVNPDIINRLIKHNKDVCSSLVYNGYIKEPLAPYKYPNILKIYGGGYKHICNWYVKNALSLKEPKLMRVDATGSCVLISKGIIKNNKIKYGYHPQGEDMYWSETVAREGYDLYCDISAFSTHIMSRSLLEMYKKGALH